MQSPELPLALEVHWPRRKEAYAKRLPVREKERIGVTFINTVNVVVASLGIHYGGHVRVERKRSKTEKEYLAKFQKTHNDKTAFETFVKELEEWAPTSACVANL